MKNFKGIIVGIIIGVVSGILVFHYTDLYTRYVKFFFSKTEYKINDFNKSGRKLNSYFNDINDKGSFSSFNGFFKLDEDDGFFITETTVYDLLNNDGTQKEMTWIIFGYKNDNNLYMVYKTGIAYLKRKNNIEYVGYWIGNSNGKVVKCPYVLSSQDKKTKEDSKKNWPILCKECEEYDIEKDKGVPIPFQ